MEAAGQSVPQTVEQANGSPIWYNALAMCGAYGFSVKDEREIYNRFGILNKLPYFKPGWNIRIGQMNPVI